MFQDLRFGLRMMIKKPGFTAVAIITLALGIGANTAIFSVVNAVLLRPLPYQQPSELAMFYFTNPQGEQYWFFKPAAYLNLKNYNSVFTDVAAWGNDTWPANLTGNGEPERLQGFQVSANLFQTLGVTAARGRTFMAEEEHPGAARVVVISYDLWQRRFGGDPEIIGRPIMLNGVAYDCIGVMPADFRFILKTDVWTTLDITPADKSDSNQVYFHQLARLKPGVSIEQARAETETLLRPYFNNSSEMRLDIKSFQAILTGSDSQMLFILLAAVSFVLLIACVNVANLLLARASTRRREFAIRAALGARRLRVVRQLLVESAMLAAFGSACGLLMANWCIKFLVGGLPEWVTAKNSHVAMLKLDGWAFGYTLALAFTTTIIFGLVPALHSSKINLNDALKESGQSKTQGRRQNRFHSLLVMTEVALAMVLLVGAGLMIKSFWRLSNINRGFQQEGVLTAKIDPSRDRYREPDQVVTFYRQLLERVSAVPGVEHAGITNGFLDRAWRVVVEEHPSVSEEQRPWAARHPVSADYFRAMGIPLRSGRFFTEGDVKSALPVVIIDETLARRDFPDENPIGKHLRFENALREIVGVVGATRGWKTFSSGDEEFARVYLPYQQENWGTMAIIVRAQSGDPMSLVPSIRRELAAMDKDQPIYAFKPLSRSVAEISVDRRFSTMLLTAFAALASVLAAIGIYGVMSYAVNQRAHEIGIRMALGADRRDVFKLIIGQGMRVVMIGLLLGLLCAIALTRSIESLLFEVRATDSLTYLVIVLLLAGTSLIACYLPARRATKTDPMAALRCE